MPPVAPVDCSSAAQTAAFEKQTTAYTLVNQPSWSVTSVTAEARFIARMTRSADVSADDPSKVVAADTPSHRADAGQKWGTLIHGLLEHAMLQKHATPEDLRRLGVWLTVEETQLRDVLDLAVNTVVQVSKADFWDQAKKSEFCSVETPFAFASHGDTILRGVIDLLFGHDGHWRIIDYKTDIGPADLVSSYQEQLKMYEQAVRSVGVHEVTTAIQPVRGAGEK